MYFKLSHYAECANKDRRSYMWITPCKRSAARGYGMEILHMFQPRSGLNYYVVPAGVGVPLP